MRIIETMLNELHSGEMLKSSYFRNNFDRTSPTEKTFLIIFFFFNAFFKLSVLE